MLINCDFTQTWLGQAVGVGIDLVHIPSFLDQLQLPGTSFTQVFTENELANTKQQPHRLASRWAAKEALIKAWGATRNDLPPAISAINWAEIEVVIDNYGRPKLGFHGEVAIHLNCFESQLSLTHEHDYAGALVLLRVNNG